MGCYCAAEDEVSPLVVEVLLAIGTHLPFTSSSPSGQISVFFGALEGSADDAFGSTEDDAGMGASEEAALGSTDEDDTAGASDEDEAVVALVTGAALGAADEDGSTELEDDTGSADELTGAAAEDDTAADELAGALAEDEGCSLTDAEEAALEEGSPLADETMLDEDSLEEAPLAAADDETSLLLALDISPDEAELLASALDAPLPICCCACCSSTDCLGASVCCGLAICGANTAIVLPLASAAAWPGSFTGLGSTTVTLVLVCCWMKLMSMTLLTTMLF